MRAIVMSLVDNVIYSISTSSNTLLSGQFANKNIIIYPNLSTMQACVALSIVRFARPSGAVHEGVASTWLERLATARMETATTMKDIAGGSDTITWGPLDQPMVPVYFRGGGAFRPPSSLEGPLIMIGPGTGVAPFLYVGLHPIHLSVSVNVHLLLLFFHQQAPLSLQGILGRAPSKKVSIGAIRWLNKHWPCLVILWLSSPRSRLSVRGGTRRVLQRWHARPTGGCLL